MGFYFALLNVSNKGAGSSSSGTGGTSHRQERQHRARHRRKDSFGRDPWRWHDDIALRDSIDSPVNIVPSNSVESILQSTPDTGCSETPDTAVPSTATYPPPVRTSSKKVTFKTQSPTPSTDSHSASLRVEHNYFLGNRPASRRYRQKATRLSRLAPLTDRSNEAFSPASSLSSCHDDGREAVLRDEPSDLCDPQAQNEWNALAEQWSEPPGRSMKTEKCEESMEWENEVRASEECDGRARVSWTAIIGRRRTARAMERTDYINPHFLILDEEREWYERVWSEWRI